MNTNLIFAVVTLVLWIIAGVLVLSGRNVPEKHYKIHYAICWIVLLFNLLARISMYV